MWHGAGGFEVIAREGGAVTDVRVPEVGAVRDACVLGQQVKSR